ncbi:MAG: carboxypeptidase regulatory-like domain-containing protein [Candidatus Magasanikbacteria bacterium]|nr:carboxypeptidase regulatory-like domain-containing protein [Candidatus Magasanikbacteria bacterium]
MPVGQKFSLSVKTRSGARSVTSKFIFKGALTDKEQIQKTINNFETFFEKAIRGLKNIFARKVEAAELPAGVDANVYQEEVTTPTESGVYELQTTIDYDGKIMEKKDAIIVYPKGMIATKTFWGKQKLLNNADIAIFRKNTETGNFEIWNAGEFGFENPVKTAQNGEYYFSVPAGEYQTRVSAKGYEPYIGEFTVADGEQKIINDIVFLKRSPWNNIWWIAILLILAFNFILRIKKKFNSKS